MNPVSSLYRTEHTKHVWYGGDGSGRDQYIVFPNGGLNAERSFKSPIGRHFELGTTLIPPHRAQPRRNAQPCDYAPDGSGRDSYITLNYGLKRNYQDGSQEKYKAYLRQPEHTPVMDQKAMLRKVDNGGGSKDLSCYNNWMPVKYRNKIKHELTDQKARVERLASDPKRTTLMGQYLQGTATVDKHPSPQRIQYQRSQGGLLDQSKKSQPQLQPIELPRDQTKESGKYSKSNTPKPEQRNASIPNIKADQSFLTTNKYRNHISNQFATDPKESVGSDRFKSTRIIVDRQDCRQSMTKLRPLDSPTPTNQMSILDHQNLRARANQSELQRVFKVAEMTQNNNSSISPARQRAGRNRQGMLQSAVCNRAEDATAEILINNGPIMRSEAYQTRKNLANHNQVTPKVQDSLLDGGQFKSLANHNQVTPKVQDSLLDGSQFKRKVIGLQEKKTSPKKRCRPGHNMLLDDIEISKVVNNGPEFFRQAKFNPTSDY